MAAITKSEIISLALTRDLDTDHILDTDIAISKKMFVDAYLDDITFESAIYDDYVKPVIAFGVLSNIFYRIASEITDRGVVAMVSEGANGLDQESKLSLLDEIKTTLGHLIDIMTIAADDESNLTFERIGFTGEAKQEKL